MMGQRPIALFQLLCRQFGHCSDFVKIHMNKQAIDLLLPNVFNIHTITMIQKQMHTNK